MKIYKSYYIVRGKNTNKIFFYIIISFFGKKIAIVLLEIPSISNKFFITNETYIVFIIIFFFFFCFLFVAMIFFLFLFLFLFLYHQKNLFKFLLTIFCTHVYQGVCEIRLEQFFNFFVFNFACSFSM